MYYHWCPLPQGYHVYKIVEGSPADRCGKIKLGDRIMEVMALFLSLSLSVLKLGFVCPVKVYIDRVHW